MNFKEFFLLDTREQFLRFDEFRIEVKNLIEKCLWVEFKKGNNVLVDECVSVVLEEVPTDDQNLDTTKHLLVEDRNSDNELEELKTDVVLKFHDLIRNLNDN